MSRSASVTLYGNVGGEPERRIIPARRDIRVYYDPKIDDEVEKEVEYPECELRTFSVATSAGKDENGKEITRWIRCADWAAHSSKVRTGDRVVLKGYFRTKTYTDRETGEAKASRTFTVEDLRITRRSTRYPS